MNKQQNETHLSVKDLLLAELVVSSQLSHIKAVRFETLREVAHHFLHKRFHGSNVDDLIVMRSKSMKG